MDTQPKWGAVVLSLGILGWLMWIGPWWVGVILFSASMFVTTLEERALKRLHNQRVEELKELGALLNIKPPINTQPPKEYNQ